MIYKGCKVMKIVYNGKKKKQVAWGITGSGDQIVKTLEIMKKMKEQYQNLVDIIVYPSKAGNQVLKYYKQVNELKENFDRVLVEIDANSPFLAGALQTGKFEFLLIAPVTSNTTAKISLGIADSLLSNAAIMALKAFIPVYIMPSDYKEGIIITKLPNGRELKLRVRKEDAYHVKKLRVMDDVFILQKPAEIGNIFKKHFNSKELLL